MIGISVFGAGRIGMIHAANIAAHPAATLHYVVDLYEPAAQKLASACNATAVDATTALADPKVQAVVIASPTDTHAELIMAAARAGKAIFCEKPVDLSAARVRECLDVVCQQKGTLAVGFNRRFDPSFAALQEQVVAKHIGDIESVVIISRDPAPPPPSYIKSSGGLFRDMMIHDLDMARWLLGEEPVTVYAAASCLVDAEIGTAGDVDTAAVTLKTASGRLCQISNSRRASYGYDQRIEVFGSGGMLRAENKTENTVQRSDALGTLSAKPLHFFLERYREAYQRELHAFIESVRGGDVFPVNGEDGLRALLLADAATESSATGSPVTVSGAYAD